MMPFGAGLVNQCGRGRVGGNPLPTLYRLPKTGLALLAEGGHALDQSLGLDGEGRQIGLDLDPPQQQQIEGGAERGAISRASARTLSRNCAPPVKAGSASRRSNTVMLQPPRP